MILGIAPRLNPQFKNTIKNNSNGISFRQVNLATASIENAGLKISEKSEKLFKKACNKIKILRLEMDPVEKAYIDIHPQTGGDKLFAKDMYHRPVTFTLTDEQSKSFEITHFPVKVSVKNGLAQISPISNSEEIDYKDPNKYLEWGLEAICAA